MKKKPKAVGRENRGRRIQARITDEPPPEQQTPLFCLHYLRVGYSIKECQQVERASLAEALSKLSQLTWNQIRQAPKHGLGAEPIARSALKHPPPPHITEDVKFLAIRFYGKAPMVGYRSARIFHILWLDRGFTLYDHS